MLRVSPPASWLDVSILIKTVANHRETERRELERQMGEQKISFQLVTGNGDEPPRENFRRLLLAAIAACRPWFAHVEDDAYLSPRFGDDAMKRLHENIADVWTFYSSRIEDLKPEHAARGWRRVTGGAFANSQCVMIPTIYARQMLDALPSWEIEHLRDESAVDYFIGWFVRKNKLTLCASIPSLVQHRQLPSLLRHRKRYGRISRTFAKAFGAVPGEESETAEAMQKASCR